MNPKKRVSTPIDFFMQTYAMDHRRDYEYHPGVEVGFKTSMMAQEDIEELLDVVNRQGLRVQFNGELYIYEPTDDDEEPETREGEPTVLGIPLSQAKAMVEEVLASETGKKWIATMKEQEELEALEEKKRKELTEALETRTPEEAEGDRIEQEMKDLDRIPLTEENLEVARDIIAMAEGTPLEKMVPQWIRDAVKVDDEEAVAIEEPVRTYAETEADEEAVEVEEEIIPEALREIPDGEPPT